MVFAVSRDSNKNSVGIMNKEKYVGALAFDFFLQTGYWTRWDRCEFHICEVLQAIVHMSCICQTDLSQLRM